MIELIQGGSVTSPKRFLAGGTYAGLKTEKGTLDLGILMSECQAALGAVFTTNQIESPSVTTSRIRAAKGLTRGVVANSGCANCCVGTQGLTDAEEMVSLAADHADVDPDQMLICSTGMIGVELPMALIRQNISNIDFSDDGGQDFARAIMTTDTRPKSLAISLELDGTKITIGAAAKGVGMVHPNMATMLCFLTTDAQVERSFLQQALRSAVGESFNMIDIDGDQSTNDTVLIIANGAAGGELINGDSNSAAGFQAALTYMCVAMAKELVKDGEGAERLIEVVVDGAKTIHESAQAARAIASSSLVKAMVHGKDPNWGRIMMALGKSGVGLEESKIDIFINEIHLVHGGMAIPYFKDAVMSAMAGEEIRFNVNLNLGDASSTAWGCDLTEEYVTFNSAYST